MNYPKEQNAYTKLQHACIATSSFESQTPSQTHKMQENYPLQPRENFKILHPIYAKRRISKKERIYYDHSCPERRASVAELM